jgi:hypothetical protein
VHVVTPDTCTALDPPVAAGRVVLQRRRYADGDVESAWPRADRLRTVPANAGRGGRVLVHALATHTVGELADIAELARRRAVRPAVIVVGEVVALLRALTGWLPAGVAVGDAAEVPTAADAGPRALCPRR